MGPINRKGAPTKYPGIKLREDGRYHVQRTWINPRTGRQERREKIVAGTLDQALEVHAALRELGPSIPGQQRPKFGAFASSWLARHKHKLAPSTLDRYTTDVAHLTVSFGDWWVDAIDLDGIESWQAGMAGKFAAPTINGWHRTLRLILKAAVARHLLPDNPARAVPTLGERRTKGARGTSLSAAQMKTFLDGAEACVAEGKITAEMGRIMVALAWTGMRLGELIALRFASIVEGEIRVEESVWRTHVKATKADDPRRVTVVEPLEAALAAQRQHLLQTQHPGLASGIVFPGSPQQARAGARVRKAEGVSWYRSQSAIQEAFATVCEHAKCPRITPHSLRRTFEDLLREAGIEQLVRRAVAGWRSDRAHGIYATVQREDRDNASAALVRLVLG